MTMPVYILPNVRFGKGAANADSEHVLTEWTEIPSIKAKTRKYPPFVYVDHNSCRYTSRWVSVENKLPFHVSTFRLGRFGGLSHIASRHRTLEAAVKAAHKLAQEESE